MESSVWEQEATQWIRERENCGTNAIQLYGDVTTCMSRRSEHLQIENSDPKSFIDYYRTSEILLGTFEE